MIEPLWRVGSSACALCRAWIQEPKAFRLFAISLILCVSYYVGVDVIPGDLEHAQKSEHHNQSDVSLLDWDSLGDDPIVRLQNANGKEISDAEERRISPLLEDLDIAIERGQLDEAAKVRESLKRQQILTDEEIDGITTKGHIDQKLEQMAATVPIGRHIFRFFVIVVFILQPDLPKMVAARLGKSVPPILLDWERQHGVFVADIYASILIEFLLPFAPNGHPETTGGRHFEGKRVWWGLQRHILGYFILFQVAALLVAHTVSCEIVFKLFCGKSRAQLKEQVNFWNVLFLSGGSMLVFLWLGRDLYLKSGGMQGLMFGGTDEDMSKECKAEYTKEVAESMYWFYLLTTAWQLLRACIVVITCEIEGLTHTSKKRPVRAPPFWFWFLLLYFSPLEDAAIAVIVTCAHQVLVSLSELVTFNRPDHKLDSVFDMLHQMCDVVQFSHFLITIFAGCHYPKVLWLPAPALFTNTCYLVGNVCDCLCRREFEASFSGSDRYFKFDYDEGVQVKVFRPKKLTMKEVRGLATKIKCFQESLTKVKIPYGDLDHWEIIPNVRVDMEKRPFERGNMRCAYRTYDHKGAIFEELEGKNDKVNLLSSLEKQSMGKCKRLVAKRIRGLGLDCLPPADRKTEEEEMKARPFQPTNEDYFRDAFMQVVCAALAEDFNKRTEGPTDVTFLPVAIIYCERRKAYYAVEPEAQGDWHKWTPNYLVPRLVVEKLHPKDPLLPAFQHFSLEESNQKGMYGGRLLVTDIQGGMQGKDSYNLTDPQVHSDYKRRGLRTATSDDYSFIDYPDKPVLEGRIFGMGDNGKKGIEEFMEDHICSRTCEHLGLDKTGKSYDDVLQKELRGMRLWFRTQGWKERPWWTCAAVACIWWFVFWGIVLILKAASYVCGIFYSFHGHASSVLS